MTSISIPSNLPALLQGAKDAATAHLATAVTSIPLLGQTEQLLAVLRLLAIMNVGQLGSLATLTNLPAVQSAVTLLDEPDLITVVHVLESQSILYSTATGGLLANVVGFLAVVEELVPLVRDLRAAVAYLVLQQLGLTGARDVVDETVVQGLPGGDGGAAGM